MYSTTLYSNIPFVFVTSSWFIVFILSIFIDPQAVLPIIGWVLAFTTLLLNSLSLRSVLSPGLYIWGLFRFINVSNAYTFWMDLSSYICLSGSPPCLLV